MEQPNQCDRVKPQSRPVKTVAHPFSRESKVSHAYHILLMDSPIDLNVLIPWKKPNLPSALFKTGPSKTASPVETVKYHDTSFFFSF